MYCIELAIKLSPMPLVVQRKEHVDAQRLYSEVIDSIQKGNQRLLELIVKKWKIKELLFLLVKFQLYRFMKRLVVAVVSGLDSQFRIKTK